jgi:hypothetical protein
MRLETQADSWQAGSEEESTAVDTLAMMWSTGRWSCTEEDATSPLEPRKVKAGRGKKNANKAAAVGRPTCPFQAGSVVVASFGEIDLRLSWRTGSSSSYVLRVSRHGLPPRGRRVERMASLPCMIINDSVMKCVPAVGILTCGVQLLSPGWTSVSYEAGRVLRRVRAGVGDSTSYVWPVGFRSRRLYTSKYQKDKRVWCVAVAVPQDATHGTAASSSSLAPCFERHACLCGFRRYESEIFDAGVGKAPMTRVTALGEDPPYSYVGPTPTHAWQQAIEAVNNVSQTRRRCAVRTRSNPAKNRRAAHSILAQAERIPT